MNTKLKLLSFIFFHICLVAPPVCLCAPAPEGGVSDLVDLFTGTAGDHGQVDPAACVPYGMARVCPDMDPPLHAGYDYNTTRISGISVNRISGVGCKGSGGNLSLRPAAADAELNIVKCTETARPGYYAVTLDNGVRAELTATHNTAVERFGYPAGEQAVMMFDAASSFVKTSEASYEVVSDREVAGFISAGTTCNRGIYTIYYTMRTDRPFTVVAKKKNKLFLSFGQGGGEPVEVRISMSPIDIATARREADLLAAQDFGEIKAAAAAQWARILGKITVKGGTEDDKRLFYTSLYRVFLSPGHVTSHDGRFRASDGAVQRADGFTYYGSWSIWDSYRTKFPLIALVDPSAMRDFGVSLSRLYRHGKRDWATEYEPMPTVRTEHASLVMLDAYRKGITDIELRQAYPYIKAELETRPVDRPDLRLETAIDIWTAAGIAAELGEEADRVELDRRAAELFTESWRADFMVPDSSYRIMKASGLYQGTKWQYRWAAPQYLDIMSRLKGGEGVLAGELEYFFANNLNNQGNEPGIHAAYIFNRLGRPERAQEIIRDMLTRETTHLYGGNAEYPEPVVRRIFRTTPDGFLPEMDDDDGTMCAWYVFSAMGIFPLEVGRPYYEIVSPLFDEVALDLSGGKVFTIRVDGRRDPSDKIREASLGGRRIRDFRLPHRAITAGGTLTLKYQSNP